MKVVSSLKNAYLSEGVSTLNVAGKVEFLTPLCSTLQFDKVREAKIAEFGPFHGLPTHRRQHIPQEVLIPVCQYSCFGLATLLWLWPFHGSR
jgi:hypothetical protein